MRKVGFAIALFVIATVNAFAFTIKSYDTIMDVQRDSSIIVTETIVADFRGDSHHGIYRDIPFSVKDNYQNTYRIRCQVLSITDEHGNALQTQTSWQSGNLHLRIGDPNVLCCDVRTYVIRYKMMRAVLFSHEDDEIYWNVVGPEWVVPIERATCIITLPSDAKAGQLRALAYTGIYGSTSPASCDAPNQHTIRYWATRPLAGGECMTIVAGWPKGMVTKPSPTLGLVWVVTDNPYFLVVPVFLLGLWFLWTKKGRDPDTGKSETVTYDPPDNLNPAELGTLIDEKVDMRDISASILDLAVRGYIHVTPTTDDATFFHRMDHTLTLNQQYGQVMADGNLSAFEKELIKSIFCGDQQRDVSDLSGTFYMHLPRLKAMLYQSMVDRGYFTHSPDSVRASYVVVGGAIMAAPISALLFAPGRIAPGWTVSLLLCGLAMMFASRIMPRKTAKGKDVLLQVRGFEEYLSRAEREQIVAQDREGYFDKFLPYAMALGIASRWAKAFDGLQTQPPQWYGWGNSAFSPMIFTHSLNSSMWSWSSAMSAQPRSRGGGGFGGFGGGFSGGFSGGGFGGGGGGGW